MSIHNGYYWYRMSLEDRTSEPCTEDVQMPCTEDVLMPCTERALRLLRKYIYIIILPRDVNSVKEYGRGLSGNFETEDVCKAKSTPLFSLCQKCLTLSQTTNFGLSLAERVCRRQF